jgi:hypothetical protein
MKDYCLLVLSKETMYPYGTDGFRNTNQERHYQNRKKIKEFVILMKHTDKDWFSRTSVALLDIYRYKKQGNP